MEQKYVSKIVKAPSTNLVTCNFETEEEIENYKTLHKIIFDDKPKEKPDLSTPEGRKFENQRIASVLNLREHLHDVNLSKEYCDILGISDAKIVIVNSEYNKNGVYRDGTAVYISKSHSKFGVDKEEINKIYEQFINPKKLEIYVDNKNKNRFFFITKRDEEHVNYLIVDKKGDNNFEFFDIYDLRNKSYKQKKKRMTKIL